MKTKRETRAEIQTRQRRIAQYMLEDGLFFQLGRLIERTAISKTQAEVMFRYLESNPDIELDIMLKPKRIKVVAINDDQEVIAWDSNAEREKKQQHRTALWQLSLGTIKALPKELA
ncbi:hypothetical protein Q4519_20645 [Motilimonas sp. 1_MG-2023]|uniref:hypothetical protein n=1 Tax=Motilimonas sp. 1_MG-2023 TaxID=3062672 RepID=UPI0026E30BB9|nr:hypothetical protein [Motilimonas sp. 1_MG-2023]MDO6528087.1 hypothetical protein [Motilimonas sp. 1_MG-2023]